MPEIGTTLPTPVLTAVLAAARYDQLVAIPRSRRTPEQNARVRELAAEIIGRCPCGCNGRSGHNPVEVGIPPRAPLGVKARPFLYEFMTFEAALAGLECMEQSVAQDAGEEAVEAGWGDLVHAVALGCSPAVRAEFYRSQGVDPR